MNRLERILLDHSKEILLLVDAQTLAICEANATASIMLGYSYEALLGKSITELESSLPDVFYWEDVLQGNITELNAVESLYRCADGNLLPIIKTIRSVHIDGRNWLTLRILDARAQKKTEEDLGR